MWRPTRSILAFSAGSKETDLLGKAAESAHRQAQADVAELVFLLGEGAWSVSPSPWPVIRQEFSIPENSRRPCKDRPWLPFGDSVSLLSASEPVPGSDQPGRNADWMIGGDLRRASGRADHRAAPVPALPLPLHERVTEAMVRFLTSRSQKTEGLERFAWERSAEFSGRMGPPESLDLAGNPICIRIRACGAECVEFQVVLSLLGESCDTGRRPRARREIAR